MTSGKTIITYLIDGTPTGIKTVEFSNRLIKGIAIPRKDFKIALERKELQSSGIYFLLWEDQDGNSLAYIGQATILWKRIDQHNKDNVKDFWNTAVAFTYKDGTLNESDINYLEKELIKEAKQINRFKIENGNSGNKWLIQEFRIPDMIEFIKDLKILMTNLWFNVLKELVDKKELKNKERVYFLTIRWSQATWIYSEEWFIVMKGSKWPIELQEWQKKKGYAFRNRPVLLEKGIIKEENGEIVFLQDHWFTSPSWACDFVSWGSFNGWDFWKNKEGKTLDEVERKNT